MIWVSSCIAKTPYVIYPIIQTCKSKGTKVSEDWQKSFPSKSWLLPLANLFVEPLVCCQVPYKFVLLWRTAWLKWARYGMNFEVQYLLLKRNKMLLFLIIHLSMYDISYVHHCNNTNSTHSSAKLLKRLQRAFPYQNGKKQLLSLVQCH